MGAPARWRQADGLHLFERVGRRARSGGGAAGGAGLELAVQRRAQLRCSIALCSHLEDSIEEMLCEVANAHLPTSWADDDDDGDGEWLQATAQL